MAELLGMSFVTTFPEKQKTVPLKTKIVSIKSDYHIFIPFFSFLITKIHHFRFPQFPV